jgi:hypothetical protein
MKWRRQIRLAVFLIALGLQGCGGSSPVVPPTPNTPTVVTVLTVNPAAVTVEAGSANTFKGVFVPSEPTGGALTWSIAPAAGGTITEAGVLTASTTAGIYAVQATWTPPATSKAAIIKGSSTVTIIPVPPVEVVISLNQVQASGANQATGTTENGVVVGQGISSERSVDSGGTVAVFSSFPIPANCAGSSKVCQ